MNQMEALFEYAAGSQNCIEAEGVDRHPGRKNYESHAAKGRGWSGIYL